MCTHAHMSHTCTPSLLFLPSIWPHFQCLYRTGTCIGQYCVGSVAVIFAVQNKTLEVLGEAHPPTCGSFSLFLQDCDIVGRKAIETAQF